MVTDYFEFMQYIDSLGIPYKEHGDELYFEYCPFCEKGKTSKPYGHFHFNKEKQTFFCHHRNSCGESGGLYHFKMLMGHINPVRKTAQKKYTRPAEDKAIVHDSDKFYEMYHKERGISPEVLKKYDVGLKRDGSKRYIVYKFYSEKGILINRKYRNFRDKKDMRQEKGAELVYYGMQHVDTEKKDLYICEGEDDCHALAQMGLDNVVSLPSGAGTYTPAMDRFNGKFEQLYLMFDADETGQEGARKFAEKAGMHKCLNVVMNYKDARDCLLNGMDIFDVQKMLNRATVYKHDDITTAPEYRERFFKSIRNPEQITGKPIMGHTNFNRIVGGIRLQEVTILTGHTGRGKSTFAYNLAMWCHQIGHNVLIMNFENSMTALFKKLISIQTGEKMTYFDKIDNKWKFAQTDEWMKEQYEKLERKNICYLDKEGGSSDGYYDIKRVESIIEYAYKFYNINVVIIDHLHYFLKVSDARNPTYAIDEAIRKMSVWKTRFNCHILCITHPHKTEDSRSGKPVELGVYSGKGSSAIPQEADNFWVIGRRDGTNNSTLKIKKNRETGTFGEINYKVRENGNTFEESDTLSDF